MIPDIIEPLANTFVIAKSYECMGAGNIGKRKLELGILKTNQIIYESTIAAIYFWFYSV